MEEQVLEFASYRLLHLLLSGLAKAVVLVEWRGFAESDIGEIGRIGNRIGSFPPMELGSQIDYVDSNINSAVRIVNCLPRMIETKPPET